jgi:transcriptional regulator with XRE-family HTH domain
VSITPQQFRAARSFLGWSQRKLAAKARVGRATIANFELGLSTPQVRVMEAMVAVFDLAGVVFLDADTSGGPGIRLKLGAEMPPITVTDDGETEGEDSEGGLKAAWDFEGEEDADLDALLGEQPAPNPDMAEIWRADPQAWARLSEGGRETLSRSMFGDCRAAGEGYFRGEHHAG